MKFFITLSALALVLPALGAPFTKLAVKKSPTGAKADSYIVVLKDGANKASHLTSLSSAASFAPSSSKITYDKEYSTVLNGYAAILKGAALDHVLADPDVAYVEEDGLIQINFDVVERELTEAEIEARDAHQKLVRSLRTRAGGAGVNVYGVDTGIRTTHNTFGGRASWGATFGNYASADGNGHGTHTASTAVGATYGVATSANVIAVKVLSDSGSGSNSDVIAGMNWAVNNALSSGKPSIVTMSLGGSASSAVDSAVSSGTSQGVHFTVAAGNSNVDASSTSPARAPSANTVGAVDSSNKKASFSNYGSVLDIWAPGVNILGAWYTSNTATNTISGTSMATPFVAGVLAVAISNYGNKSPASLTADLKSHARAVVTGAPSGTTNLLATVW
jgi:cerevisin